MTRIGWLDCTSGVSGDMLLGALSHLGALGELDRVLAAARDLGASLDVDTVQRGALRATRVAVRAPAASAARSRADVQDVLDRLPLPDDTRARAGHVFDRLVTAESQVHGVPHQEVHFHEVGAVDAIVDIVGACLGFTALGLDELVVSPVALGGGTTASEHGPVPVPGPAVLELVRGTPLVVTGGDATCELATPTGVAVLAELATASGPMPTMTVTSVGTGAGHRDLATRPNVVRLVVGEAAAPAVDWVVVEANVDDLDPRLLPGTIEALLAAGAADAWVTPIVMKKGRPAFTVSALTEEPAADAVRRALFAETSTIGVRTVAIGKQALARDWRSVDVGGREVRVKLAYLDGRVISANPEWTDVDAAARLLRRPAKDVLAEAIAAARGLLA